MAIENFVPKLQTSIDNVGFLFGAGTSCESGYPLVGGLTKQVVGALNPTERDLLDKVLLAHSQCYDDALGTPNIEEISDMVIEHHTNSQLVQFENLKERIRELVRDVILSVEKPDLTNQVAFFEKIKTRAFNRATEVWVFTTNYDLLFELACAEVGLKVVNGFNGTTTRYFSEREFSLVSGTLAGRRFSPENALTVRLIKLHGSVSWFCKDGRVLEAAPSAISRAETRCMVLPRRTKVLETLARPYDRLFRISSTILGGKCKHLISSGFSFGDNHINETIVIPKVESGEIAFFNFCQDEPVPLAAVRSRPNVWHYCKDKVVNAGQETEASHATWKFSEFVKLF